MANKNEKTAFGYLRVSDKSQIKGESLRNQRDSIQRYADANGITVLKWYTDKAKSGKNTDRPELQKLLKDAINRKRGSLDYVLVYKMNRASRNLQTYMMGFVSVLEPRGIKVRSATEDFDDSPMGKFVENLHVMVGELDNDNKRQTVIDNMTSIAKDGYWQHKPIVGYDRLTVKNGEGKGRPSMKPNAQGDLVRKVLMRWNRGDIKEAELARYAAKIGLLNTKGRPITQYAIHSWIVRPEYAGYIHDKFTGYELVDGKHEGLISKDVYWENQEILKRKSKEYLLGLKHHEVNKLVPLRRFILCVNCRKPMTSSNPGGKQRYYCARPSCRQSGSIVADEAHDKFIELLKDVTPTDGVLRLMREVLVRTNRKERGNLDAEKKELHARLDEIALSRTDTIELLIKKQITVEEKQIMTTKLEQEQRDISEQLDNLEQRLLVSEAQIDYALEYMSAIYKKWQTASLEVQQKFQSLIFPNGFVYDIKNQNFIIDEISPLYRYKTKQKELPASENSYLVIPPGIEPGLPG